MVETNPQVRSRSCYALKQQNDSLQRPHERQIYCPRISPRCRNARAARRVWQPSQRYARISPQARNSGVRPPRSARGRARRSTLGQVMTALPLKADMCAATRYVRFVPDSGHSAIHSITVSCSVSKDGDTSRPSILAVLRLITSSNLVGAWTGSSPGLAPRIMRST